MDTLSHALIGKIISTPENNKRNIFWIVFFSILADLFLIPVYIYLGYINNRFLWIGFNGDWDGLRISHPFLVLLNDIPHSLIFAFLIILPAILLFKLPKLAFFAYLFHILIDIPTHTGEWAIRIFYPLNDYSIKGFTDAWQWPIKYMAICWIVSIVLIIAFRYLKKNADSSNANRTNP
jgi:hypothetical protein